MANMMNAANRMMSQNGTGGGGFTDYTINVDDDANVRRYRLPAVDEDNKPKKYSAEELKQLKGEGNVIGYSAAYDDLQVGQTISCRLSVQRTDPTDPNKVTWTTVQNLTGKIQKVEATSQKQFVLRVNGVAAGGYGQQRRGNNTVAATPNKLATLIVIYSEYGPGVAKN
jgi:hypothetical protein